MDINYSGLYYLKNLKNLTLSVKNSTQHLDFSKFVDLESLFVDWYQKFPDLTQCNNLKELHLWKFKPKTKSFSELVLPKNLEVLSITQSNIQSLRELCLPNLKDFGAYYCNSLDNTEGINKFSENLQTLIFQYSRKLVNYNDLKFCKKLEKLIIADCGNIPNLNWLTELKNIKHFSFWNTTLNDGNVKPCFGIDYVSFKDSKHYNFKESDFVKKT